MNNESILISKATGISVAELFESQAIKNPQALAVINLNGDNYTYRTFLLRVLKLSTVLIKKGIKPKDRISILSENRLEYLELEMACAKIGAILATINWRLADKEVDYCISLVKPKLIFLSSRFHAKVKLSSIKKVPVIFYNSKYETLLNNEVAYTGRSLGSGEDILVILFTSGTTGYPKGAQISHRAFIARAMYFAYEYKINEGDTFPAWAPMFHMASTDLAIGSLIIGSSVAFVDGFQPKQLKILIQKYKLSWLVLMPGMLEGFIKYVNGKKIKIKGIKAMGAMADLIPKKQITEITTLLDTPYLNSFGSTETGMPPASGGVISKRTKNFSLSKVQSSFCEVILVNNNKVAEEGYSGECAVRGPTLFSGYWQAEATNLKDFKNSWFHMGDIMKRNKNGTLDFVDRKKYLIKSGGENIYPAEIERILLSHKNVSEAIVVKINSEKWGESPIAIISIDDVLEKDVVIKQLKKLCRSSLAGYKQPVDILIINEIDIPRSTTGKVQRHFVEKMLKTYFNIESFN